MEQVPGNLKYEGADATRTNNLFYAGAKLRNKQAFNTEQRKMREFKETLA